MGASALEEKCRQVSGSQIANLALLFMNEWTPPGAEAAVARLLVKELQSVGVDEVCLDEEFKGSPSVICWIRGQHPGPTMQWHGHMDTIAAPHSAPVIEDDMLTGRGACDMKGALASMVAAVRILRECGFPRRGQLLLTFHGLHEEGGSRPLLRLFERGIVGDSVLIGELGSGPDLITASSGLSFWNLNIDAGSESVHETNRDPGTPNLIAATMRAHAELVEYSRTIEQRGGSLFVGQSTVGDYYNRVPVNSSIAGTRRHAQQESLETVRLELLGLATRLEQDLRIPVTLTVDGIAEAYSIDSGCEIAMALRSAYHQVTGQSMRVRSTRSVGNAAHFVRIAGIPAVYHGTNYASAHSDREQASLAELAEVAASYALTTAFFLEPDIAPDPPDLIG